ncbi:hypothetical protein GCM10028857_09230 [Salinarchaeum chitinilyticum]
MNRRALLSGLATGTAVLAGCLARGTGGGDGNGSSADDQPPGSSDGNSEAPPSVDASTIETTGADCGTADVGTATAKRAEGTVTVEGTIGAPTPCHEAVIVGTEIRNRQLVLRVDVESVGSVCEQCLGAVDYTATVYVSNVDQLHGTTVEHVGSDEHVTNWAETGDGAP